MVTTLSNEHKNLKSKVDVEQVKNQMSNIFKKKEDWMKPNEDAINLSNGLGDHLTPN